MPNFLDIGIVVVAIVLLIVGLVKGMFKQLWELVSFVALVAVLALVAKPFTDLIIKAFNLYAVLGDGVVKGWLGGAAFTTPFGAAEQPTLANVLATMGIPTFLIGAISSIVTPLLPATVPAGGYILQTALTPLIVNIIVGLVCVIVLMIVTSVVLILLSKLISLLFKFKVIKGLDKVLGMVFTVGIFYVVLSIAMGSLSLIATNATVGQYVTMALNYIKGGTLSSLLYVNNPIGAMFVSIFGGTIVPLP